MEGVALRWSIGQWDEIQARSQVETNHSLPENEMEMEGRTITQNANGSSIVQVTLWCSKNCGNAVLIDYTIRI
jgi:hypothetical protein